MPVMVAFGDSERVSSLDLISEELSESRLISENHILKESLSNCSLNENFESTEIYVEITDGAEEQEPVVVHRDDESLSVCNRPYRHLSFDSLAGIAPLSLKSVSLAANQLVDVDLAALSLCVELTSLCLNGNKLTSVHLDPLARCPKLEKLWLHNNLLTEIDLSPLSGCSSFRSLYLDNNKIDETTLNLEPLRGCRLLKSLRLSGNALAGKLDISPMLESHTLSVFAASASVWLYAKIQPTEPQNILPQAFRRRNMNINWVVNSQPRPHLKCGMLQEEVRYHVALLGFRKSLGIYAEALLGYDTELEVTLLPRKDEEALEKAAGSDVVLVWASEEQLFRALHAKRPSLPILVVGSFQDPEAAGSCLRHGATMLLREPLTGLSVLTVKSIAEKYRNTRVEECASYEVPKTQQATTSLLTPDDGTIDFSKIRARYLNRTLSRLGRCHLEEPALLILFSRQGGHARFSDFKAITSLCGLPMCASEVFFRSIFDWSEDENLTERVVTTEQFTSFWRENIHNVHLEARLFHVMRRPGESRVRRAAVSLLLGELAGCKTGGRPAIRELQTAIFNYAVNGKSDGYTLSEAKRAQICNSLVGAESGVFTGIMEKLTPASVNEILSEFTAVTGQPRVGEHFEPVPFKKFVRMYYMKCPLTRAALEAVSAAFSGAGNAALSIGEFARLYLACADPSTIAAVNYFFKVLDADLDGVLNLPDLAPLYWDKSGQGLEEFWVCAKDMTGCDDRGISARDLRLLPASDKKELLRTLLFKEEEASWNPDEHEATNAAKGG